MAFYKQPKPKYKDVRGWCCCNHGLPKRRVQTRPTSQRKVVTDPYLDLVPSLRTSDPPRLLRAGAGHTLLRGRGGAGPLEEAVQCLLLLRGAWSQAVQCLPLLRGTWPAINLGNVLRVLLPVQHLNELTKQKQDCCFLSPTQLMASIMV